uniref:C2H2-type domain-containing protein n=1 Tax=Anopheles maculatus TaxID=74869 RepID=A0A182SRG2_9DIPT
MFLNQPSPFSGASEPGTDRDYLHHQLDEDKNPLHFDPPIRLSLDPSTYYSCLVCGDFETNNLEELKKHVLKDRTSSAMDTILLAGQECLLCGQKAHDRSELERHLKADHHLRRLELMIHLLEGRDKSATKLRQFVGQELYKKLQLIFPLAEEPKFPYDEMPSVSEISRSPLMLLLEPKTELIERDFGAGANGIDSEQPASSSCPDNVQLKCNCCNFYTTSLEKIGVHSLSEKHIFRRICFDYLLLISSEKTTLANVGVKSEGKCELAERLLLAHQHQPPTDHISRVLLMQMMLLADGAKQQQTSPKANQLMLTCVPCCFKTDHIYYMIHHLKKSCKVEQNINLLGLRNIFKLTAKGYLFFLGRGCGSSTAGLFK